MVKGRTCVSREEPNELDMAMKPNGRANSVGAQLVASPGRYLKMPFKAYREPHRADPHARWCGEGRRKTSPYPISHLSFLTDIYISYPEIFYKTTMHHI
jgi:hypothetical protein